MKAFFDVLFRDVPDNLLVNVWTMPDKKSYWRKTSSHLPKGLLDKDIYFGVGLSDQPRGANQRLKSGQVSAITCVWADIDYGAGHAKVVPPDQATVDQLIRKCGALPSIIIHSGNGWHCYWLFESPWIFTDDGERRAAGQLVEQWQSHLRSVFQAEGYGLDATHDLTRVLRVPGTKNLKDSENPKEVKLFWPEVADLADAKRYSREQLYAVMGRRRPKKASGWLQMPSGLKPVQIDQLVLDPAAECPEKLFYALMANSEEFQNTWLHKRQDMTDRSPSGYDMALANIAASAGWADQEIADLIIAWRREYGHDVGKALRADYIKRTIAKARVSSTIDRDMDAIEPREEITEEKQGHYLEVIAERLGFPIARVIKQGLENSQYSIILPDGSEIYVGTATTLLNITRFRACVFDATQISVPAHKQDAWHRTCETLARMAEVVDDQDAIELELVGGWLDMYLEDKRCRAASDDEGYVELFVQGLPYIVDEKVHVQVMDLLRYIKFAIGHKNLELSDLRRNLRRLGFSSRKITHRHGGKVHGRNYWVGSISQTSEVENEKSETGELRV